MWNLKESGTKELYKTEADSNKLIGLPWCPESSQESACQCRRHGFEPWSGKIPTTEPVLNNQSSHCDEKPMCCREDLAQPQENLINFKF